MRILRTLLNDVFSNPQTDSKNIKKSFLFVLVYLCASAICVLCFAQFLPKKLFWFTWGISTSTAALFLWKWFVEKEGKIFFNRSKNILFLFSAGFGIGSLILSSIILLLIYLLPLKLVPVNTDRILPITGWYIALIFCAFHEEIGFRSYFLKNLQTAKGIWKSQAIIAVAFAVYHILGGQDLVTSLLSTSLWSVVFGLAAVYSRGIALPTGIHAASTIGQAYFGMKLNDGFDGLYILQPTKVMPENVTPVVLSSQAFVLTIVIILFVFLVKNKKVAVN